jgi:hypothetical protein
LAKQDYLIHPCSLAANGPQIAQILQFVLHFQILTVRDHRELFAAIAFYDLGIHGSLISLAAVFDGLDDNFLGKDVEQYTPIANAQPICRLMIGQFLDVALEASLQGHDGLGNPRRISLGKLGQLLLGASTDFD